jgi:hypothetical protein
VTLLERTDERRDAIRVDDARLVETNQTIARGAGSNGDDARKKSNDELPDLHGERRWTTAMIHDEDLLPGRRYGASASATAPHMGRH